MSERPASRRQAALGRAYGTWLTFSRNRLAMVGLFIVQIARGSTDRPSFGVGPLVREDVHPRQADAWQARLLCWPAIAAGHDPALRQQTLRRHL